MSTAFRPLDRDELARNPFRVFTSILVPHDRRFFNQDLGERLVRFIDARELFPPELLDLSQRAERERGLRSGEARRFLELARDAFALSKEPVDRTWYAELERVSGVAADIGGVSSTHINHLTPRVLDIDELWDTMTARGIAMIDDIQGPPRWNGPEVLLRQTSFRALAEPRMFREADGTTSQGKLRVRFGEVEARGVALTSRGRDRYEDLVRETDRQLSERPDARRDDVAPRVWEDNFPATEKALSRSDLAFFSYELSADRPEHGRPPTRRLSELLDEQWLVAKPIVYEDFLPRSAAGIFASNLMDRGAMDAAQGGAARDQQWLSDAIGRPIASPEWVYAEERALSLAAAADALGLPPVSIVDDLTSTSDPRPTS